MHERPIDDQRLIEALEACRPGHDDAALPELGLRELLECDARLRSLHQRLQRADARIAGAIRDVPVPDGIEQRILNRLDAEKQRRRGAARLSSRRWVIGISGVLAVAASLLLAAWLIAPKSEPQHELAILAAACNRFLEESQSPPAEGKSLAEIAPPAAFPISRSLARLPQIRWRLIRGLAGQPAVAYDLPAPGGRRATLYVLPPMASDVVRTRPPMHPMQSTGGLSASIWREGDLLYVLVIRGDARSYSGLIQPPSGPII